jgi:hypothetical protein
MTQNWIYYLNTWATISGQPMNFDLARLGYEWATVMVNLQYLPFAVAYRPAERVQAMVQKLLEAIDRILKHIPGVQEDEA